MLPLQGIPLLGDNAVLEALDFAYNAFCVFFFFGTVILILSTKLEQIRKREANSVL